MSLLLVAIGALAVGLLLVLLISAGAPGRGAAQEEAAPHAWLARLSPDELGRLLEALLTELKLDVQEVRVSADGVDLLAVSPAPLAGGRVYVRGVARPPQGVVGPEEVRSALDAARAEQAMKALVATGGAFSEQARAAAEGAPADLLDGAALLELLRRHLPQVAAAQRA